MYEHLKNGSRMYFGDPFFFDHGDMKQGQTTRNSDSLQICNPTFYV